MKTVVKCKCGGEFQIVGGEALGNNIHTRIMAVCDQCETIIKRKPDPDDLGFEIHFKNEQEAIEAIDRFNKEKT